MTRVRGIGAILVGGLLAGAVSVGLALPSHLPSGGGATPAKVTCTFENPSYSGACVESTTCGANETPASACAPILQCLNDARCVKTYCQSTSIRQGWTLKSAE
jgi:hypothetical protein